MDEQTDIQRVKLPTYNTLKHKVLLYSHFFSSVLHVAIVYFLFVEWNKANIAEITHLQIICLVVIGVCLFILFPLLFIIFRDKMKVESRARRFFHIWPLVHIGLSTVYQLVTQIIVSHKNSYERPSLYTAWATTVSVFIHLVLHSMAVFW